MSVRVSMHASATCSMRGRNREKRLPSPTVESTWISPPSSRAISRLIDRPRPVPPYLREVVPSACWNASKIRLSLSSGIPTPVSMTENPITRSAAAERRRSAARSGPADIRSTSVTPPAWVNLNAFDSRFFSTWPSRCSSETIDAGSAGSISTLNDRPFCSAMCRNARSASSIDIRQCDRREIELHPARLDLGQIEDVVDQRQQVVAGGVDRAWRTRPRDRSANRSSFSASSRGEDQHRVQRCTQLVRHVRQELRLVLRRQRQLRRLLLQPAPRDLDLLVLDLDVAVLLGQQPRLLLELIVRLAELLGLLLELLASGPATATAAPPCACWRGSC